MGGAGMIGGGNYPSYGYYALPNSKNRFPETRQNVIVNGYPNRESKPVI